MYFVRRFMTNWYPNISRMTPHDHANIALPTWSQHNVEIISEAAGTLGWC